jgi:hypothetical protein
MVEKGEPDAIDLCTYALEHIPASYGQQQQKRIENIDMTDTTKEGFTCSLPPAEAAKRPLRETILTPGDRTGVTATVRQCDQIEYS